MFSVQTKKMNRTCLKLFSRSEGEAKKELEVLDFCFVFEKAWTQRYLIEIASKYNIIVNQ